MTNPELEIVNDDPDRALTVEERLARLEKRERAVSREALTGIPSYVDQNFKAISKRLAELENELAISRAEVVTVRREMGQVRAESQAVAARIGVLQAASFGGGPTAR